MRHFASIVPRRILCLSVALASAAATLMIGPAGEFLAEGSGIVVPTSARAAGSAETGDRWAATSCTLVKPDAHTLLSKCFPKLKVNLTWHELADGGRVQEAGSFAAEWSTGIDISSFPDDLFALFDKVSTFGDAETVHATLADVPGSDCHYTGAFDGSGPDDLGLSQTGGELRNAWHDGPVQDVWWNTNILASGTLQCGAGDPGVWGWLPGPSAPFVSCDRDPSGPAGPARFGANYGSYGATGTLAAGRVDTWTFDCHYAGEASFQSKDVVGTMTMTEGPCPRVRTGDGWADLTKATREHLNKLYDALDNAGGCYRFVVGFRSQAHQTRLYNRWHAIADRRTPRDGRSAAQITAQLRAAGFAQPFTGWKANGTARGGPARPTASQHTAKRAADIRFGFRPLGTGPFQQSTELALAFNPYIRHFVDAAGLCGPPAKDLVHVEMPYKKDTETVASCHFK